MNEIEAKRDKEKKVVSLMISLYCKKKHKHKKELCSVCQELTNYALTRIERCPFMENKTFCSNCKVHCYKPDMRRQIKEVMRFSGPRMLFYHPVLAIKHVIETKKEKSRLEKEN